MSQRLAALAFGLVLVAGGLGALGLSCSATGDSDGNGGSGANGTGNNGTGAEANHTGMGGDLFDAGDPDGGDGYGCSADLKQVINSQGAVVQTCPPSQGCSGGQCVAACQAAADSKGNVGCDFMVATPYFYVGIAPPCFAVFLANNWDKDAVITMSWGGTPYDVTTFGRIPVAGQPESSWPAVPATGIPQGQVAVLFISQDPSSVNGTPLTCPISPAVNASGGTAVAGSAVGQAWHIVTDVPVSAYDILPYGGADSYLPSAELILPTTAWGTNYIAVLPPDSSGPPWGQLLASEDNTSIQVMPVTDLPPAGTVPGAPANATTSFTLNAGQYVQWHLYSDMTGSIFQADKPVVFTGGNAYICYGSATSTGGGCDSAHQIIPPVSASGAEYVAAPYATRGSSPESVRYRIVGMVEGTALSYDPPVAGAPATLAVGQKVDFESVSAFVVSSQDANHPFYLSQIMPGCNVAGNSGSDGDEEWVNQLPPAQFLQRYVFFTDPTYPTTQFVVVRSSTATGFRDVSIDCLNTLGGWLPVGASGKYEYTTAYLMHDTVPTNACTNGPHTGTSDGPFGLMVWGTDVCSSYAYPAGGNVAPINTVIVPPVPN